MNNCWEKIRALERPAGGTPGIPAGGAALCLGAGEAARETGFQSAAQVPRSSPRYETDLGVSITQAQGGGQSPRRCLP